MPVYKDEARGTWYAKLHIQKEGKTIYKTKRGFLLKKEAIAWEAQEKQNILRNQEITFEILAEIYKEEHLFRVRPSVSDVKVSMIDNLITPCFRKMPITKISELDVMKWQNQLLKPNENGKIYSQSYLYTVNTLLGSIFNYAMKHHGLKENPVKKAGAIGTLKRNGDAYWTLEEYNRFLATVDPDSDLVIAFELLFWTGIREGELLALTVSDFIFEEDIIDINKTYHFLNGKEYIAPPKSEEGCRRVKLPHSLSEELKDYISRNFKKGDERLFSFSKGILLRCLKKGIKTACLPPITVHGLRHSHVSLLISMGFSSVAVAARAGHKSTYVTLRYAHAQKGVQDRMAKALDDC